MTTLQLPQASDREAVLKEAAGLAGGQRCGAQGDMIVVTWGEPMGQVGGTNALKIVRVGEH